MTVNTTLESPHLIAHLLTKLRGSRLLYCFYPFLHANSLRSLQYAISLLFLSHAIGISNSLRDGLPTPICSRRSTQGHKRCRMLSSKPDTTFGTPFSQHLYVFVQLYVFIGSASLESGLRKLQVSGQSVKSICCS